MAVAAIIVSVIALAVAGWSAWTTHRALDLERDRRRDELAPTIEAHIDKRGGDPVVRFVSRGPLDYTSVQFTLVDTKVLTGIEVAGVVSADGDLGPMAVGDEVHAGYHRADEYRGGAVRFRLLCSTADGREWRTVADGECAEHRPRLGHLNAQLRITKVHAISSC